MGQRSDESIIDEIQDGNIFLYEEIVKRYQKPLFVFLNHIVSEVDVCEDLVQETLVSIYRSIERIDTSKKFSTYAFAVAKNTAFSYLRKHKRLISLNKVEIDANIDLYEEISQIHDEGRVRQALSALRKSYKDVISLYYFEDLSYEEIAKKLRIPVNTVRTHLRRGKEELKDILGET